MPAGPDRSRSGAGHLPGSGTERTDPLTHAARSGPARVFAAVTVAVLLLSGCATAARPESDASSTPAARQLEAPTAVPVPLDLPPVTVVGTAPKSGRRVVAVAHVTIPGHDVDMSVVPVGVAADGRMALPPDPAVAGWYRFGPDARAPHGSIVVAAHVDSLEYGLGPFVKLRDLPKDQLIRIRDAAGRITLYRVVDVRHVRKAELGAVGVFRRTGDRRLTLITCGGTFDTRTRTYSDNVIVTARAVSR